MPASAEAGALEAEAAAESAAVPPPAAGVAGIPQGLFGHTVSGVAGSSESSGGGGGDHIGIVAQGAVETQARQVALQQPGQTASEGTQQQGSSGSGGGEGMGGDGGGGDFSGGGHSSGGQQQNSGGQNPQNTVAGLNVNDIQQLMQVLMGADGQGANADGQSSGAGGDTGEGDSEAGPIEVDAPAVPEAQAATAAEQVSRNTISRVSDLIDPTLDFTHVLKRPKGDEE